jgi:hypothetical protein
VVESKRDALDEDVPTAARRALENAFEPDEEWPDISEPALTLWINARDRERRRATAVAELSRRTLVVDGSPTEFTFATAGQRWAAVGGNLTITARNVPPEQVHLIQQTTPPVSRRRQT